MVTMWSLVGGADMGGSSLEGSHRLLLLGFDVAGESLSRGVEAEAEVEVEVEAEVEVEIEVEVEVEVDVGIEVEVEVVVVDTGLVSTGERFLRNSR